MIVIWVVFCSLPTSIINTNFYFFLSSSILKVPHQHIKTKISISTNIQLHFECSDKKTQQFASKVLCLLIKIEQIIPIRKMNKKYEQAARRVAKQPAPIKQIDPLVAICNSKIDLIKQRKFITKSTNMKGKQSKRSTIIRMNKNKCEHKEPGEIWKKYLPKEEDQFGEVQYSLEPSDISKQPNSKIDILNFDKNNHNELPTPTLPPDMDYPQKKQQNFDNLDIQSLKSKLGIGIKIQDPKSPQQKFPISQQQSLSLPFPGRPFQQAPPQAPPKKIHEYPPTCKIAAIYQWPPPKSDYKLWKIQMRESRKLI